MPKIGLFILSVLLVVAVVAAVGLGAWDLRLSSELVSAQRDLASAQSQRTQLSGALDQSKADLAQAQSDLAAAKTDKAALQARLDAAGQYVTILDGIFVTPQTDAEIGRRVDATKDVQLIQLWDEARNAGNIQTDLAFVSYLVKTVGAAMQ